MDSVDTPASMSAGRSRSVSPPAAHSPCSTYRSVGNSSGVDSTTDRPGRAETAAQASL
jgi:hypothetical protein